MKVEAEMIDMTVKVDEQNIQRFWDMNMGIRSYTLKWWKNFMGVSSPASCGKIFLLQP